ncbi:MAG: hypothetical protein Q9218_006742 [Villophora microphyllina]
MSQFPDYSIYKGTWVNWSRGRIHGSTITLSYSDGALLTAFLAVFVTASGSGCWKILSYILHQVRANQKPRDGLHHQTQVIFRNTGSAVTAALQVGQLARYWRKNTVRPLARAIPVLFLALLNVAVFGVASIFSSQVTQAAGHNVLIRSASCGIVNTTIASSISSSSEWRKKEKDLKKLEINDVSSANTYAQHCYEGKAQNLLDCDQYARQYLNWVSKQNTTCPFPNSLDACIYGATGAYSMDSGLIDSHDDLGLNAPISQRVKYRQVTTCSPLNLTGYTKELEDTDPSDPAYGDTILTYVLGNVTVGSHQDNYTFRYNPKRPVSTTGYALSFLIAYVGSPQSYWVPSPTLNRTDGDISLFFLASNSVLYEDPVADPFYAATHPIQPLLRDGKNRTYYSPDANVSAMACVDQHQFCNPNNNKCTQLTGALALNYDNGRPLTQLGLNGVQNATAQLIYSIVPWLTTYANVYTRGANALRASDTLHDDYKQVGLPNGQWQQEAEAWFGVAMARLQQKIVQHTTGPPSILGVENKFDVIRPQTVDEQSLCYNTIIHSKGSTTSFSVLGVAIILVIGSILIVTSLLLDTVVQRFRQWAGKNEYKSVHYILDGQWQLQRLAYEGAGQGQWSGELDPVPVTRMNDKFGLPHSNGVLHSHLSHAKPVVGSMSYSPKPVD